MMQGGEDVPPSFTTEKEKNVAEQRVDRLKSLHRGEIAATETYVQALEQLGNDPCAGDLTAIRDDHREFANEMRKHVHELGEEPDQSSEIWGQWAKAVEGGAKLLGKSGALTALQEGEKQGINSYESALQEPIPEVCKTAIRSTLLPKMRDHVATLARLMSA
jgi:demethoxyubiquinone hydroxylase (CLK1/Coq7/Cat5 family)